MLIDRDIKSYLPNLQRAYLMRTDSNNGFNAQNALWEATKDYFNILHDYTQRLEWTRIKHDNINDLQFPSITFDYVPNEVYRNLLSVNHIYWFSVGFFIKV